MRKRGFALAAAVVMGLGALGAGAASCGGNGAVTYDPGVDAAAYFDQGAPTLSNVGQPCDGTHLCRGGLSCNGGTCAPSHAAPDGTPCTISAECKQGDYCGPQRTCAPAGAGPAGGACTSDADCGAGLRCDLVGFSAECQPEGSTDVGGACTSSADCFGGLACANKTCTPLPPVPDGGVPPLGVPGWLGETCADDPGPTQAYFRVPRGSNDGDFFRLPFPNDVRTAGGHPYLGGFPTPGPDLLGYDIVGRYVTDVQTNLDGFSTYPTITIRFSAPINFDSLKGPVALSWIELAPNGTATPVGFVWTATTGRNQYVCANSISARPTPGHPLKPGTTYAFVVSTDVVDASHAAIKQADDLAALLGSATPTDPTLTPLYTKFAALRAWAASNFSGVQHILDATVFTTANATALPQKLMTAASQAAAPTVSSWVKCGGSTPSPCPQADGDRACGAQDPDFDELHALVKLPIFQKGKLPYLTPTDGGDIDANPTVQSTADVCMALTVPKSAAMPAAGWPLVVFAHGTGGSFRSHILQGVSKMLATAQDDGGKATPIAVLGIDQVEHGTRRGGATDSPNNLFYNFANPLASRGNPLQGAADQVALIRMAKTLTVDPSVDGAAIKFASVAFWGHSQGATEGAIAMPYITGVSGVVLSGEGGSLVDALLTKHSPVDIAQAIPFAIQDPQVDVYHPVLALLQNAVDEADPINHASALVTTPGQGIIPKNVFQPYGLGDTYAPPVTEQAYAIAAQLGVVKPPSGTPSDDIAGTTPAVPPLSGNVTAGAKSYTAALREYSPASTYDGHFVAFQNADAELDVSVFLADAVSGKVPKVGH